VFKGILRRFFREFMELFFPDVAESLDFDFVELPDKELFEGFPDQEAPLFVERIDSEPEPDVMVYSNPDERAYRSV